MENRNYNASASYENSFQFPENESEKSRIEEKPKEEPPKIETGSPDKTGTLPDGQTAYELDINEPAGNTENVAHVVNDEANELFSKAKESDSTPKGMAAHEAITQSPDSSPSTEKTHRRGSVILQKPTDSAKPEASASTKKADPIKDAESCIKGLAYIKGIAKAIPKDVLELRKKSGLPLFTDASGKKTGNVKDVPDLSYGNKNFARRVAYELTKDIKDPRVRYEVKKMAQFYIAKTLSTYPGEVNKVSRNIVKNMLRKELGLKEPSKFSLVAENLASGLQEGKGTQFAMDSKMTSEIKELIKNEWEERKC